MFRHGIRIGLCILLSPVLLSPAWGQTTSDRLSEGNEGEIKTRDVVISATKTPQPITHVTSAVEVIRGEELEEKKIKTVADALRQAQGVVIFSTGGPGSEAQVRIRGASQTHTLVIVDGAVVNSPTQGFFNFANITSDNIEQIEILRGAQSMLWGSDAVGGVINIITKRGKGKPTASAFVEYGSFASIREGVQATGQKGPVDFSMSLSRWDTSNFSTINYRRGATERDRFANWQISSRLGVALPKDGRLEVNARWWNSDFGLDSLVGTTPFDAFGSKQTNRMLILSGVYDQVITQWWSQKLTLAQSNEHFIGKEGPVRRNLITGAFQNFGQPIDIELLNRRLEWQHNFQVARPLLLTAGYQFREEQGDSSTFGALRNRLISTHAGFAQAQVNLQDRVLLTGGVRQDSYNAFGDATTYRVTGGYLIPETGTKLRTSYATGFRAPTLNQLYSSIAGFSGNPNLKPEESKSFDVGVDQRLLNDNLYLSVGYFWNRFDNLIVTGTTTFNQIGHAKSQGWEAALGYTFSRQLEVKGQYTYTLTRDLDSGRRIQRWPIHTASATVSYMPFERARINVDFRYVGSRFNDTANAVKMGSFDVVNISATYDVTKHMQVYGRIDNAFDEEYEEVFLFGTPIRSVYGGLKFTL